MKKISKTLLFLIVVIEANLKTINGSSLDSINVKTTRNKSTQNYIASNEVISEEIIIKKRTNRCNNFSPYTMILKRKPLKKSEPISETAKLNINQPEFVKNYTMCAITDSYGEIMVGFINDNQKNNNKYYYLQVGESQDGITLIKADYVKGAALLSQNGIEFWIKMNKSTFSNTSNLNSTQSLIAKNEYIQNSESAYLARKNKLNERRELRIQIEKYMKNTK